MKKEAVSTASEIARETGQMLHEGLQDTRDIDTKSRSVDLVTKMDKKAERNIISKLQSAFPEHDYIAEEEHTKQTGADYRWLIDPLDGTSNYAHSLPWYGVSMAMQQRIDDSWVTCSGVVYVPLSNELFAATRNNGANVNGDPIHVSNRSSLSECMLGTGFPYSKKATEKPIFEDFERFTRQSRSIRRMGAAAIDLCYLAKGVFDGFWEDDLQPWDTAAGCLIIREAGGVTSDLNGNPHRLNDGYTVASNGEIHDDLLDILHQSR